MRAAFSEGSVCGPKDFAKEERKLIRMIAKVALMAILAEGF
jgi:hypothetical protein